MKCTEVVLAHRFGLHARPSQRLAAAASKYECCVLLEFNGDKVDVKSVLNLISLGAQRDSRLRFTFDGPDEDAAEADIIGLVNRNFDLDE